MLTPGGRAYHTQLRSCVRDDVTLLRQLRDRQNGGMQSMFLSQQVSLALAAMYIVNVYISMLVSTRNTVYASHHSGNSWPQEDTVGGWLTALFTAATTFCVDVRSGACFGGGVVVVEVASVILGSRSVSSGQLDEGQLRRGSASSGEGQS